MTEALVAAMLFLIGLTLSDPAAPMAQAALAAAFGLGVVVELRAASRPEKKA